VHKTRLQVLEECCPKPMPAGRDVRSAAGLFRALGDETRLEIVALLAAARAPVCACHIEARFDLAQPTISHHLKVLRKAGLLLSERRGTWIYYAIDPSALARIDAFTRSLGG
jgi:ArsR family transcriptional regulator